VNLADAGGNSYGWILDSNGPDWPPIDFALPVDNSRLILSPSGRATFGFVSKYKRGADVPTGVTQFIFQAGDLNFHSNVQQWLVVTGNDFARFKGEGTVNGDGPYKFLIWAGDSEPDTFRIKIWSENSGVETVIYDNGSNQAIGGGQIIIHVPKN
ncbi:MAG: hypothetical protein IIC83_07545, partial [Chloroflexi bacterium]|nr:hypothetical protein [Chloroflexota bacterium]